MALNYGMLFSQPSVGERFAMGEQEAQRNALAQQQLEQSRMQTQMTRMQYEQAIKDRAALENMADLFAKNGETGSLSEIATKMIASKLPQYVQIGVGIKQKLLVQDQLAKILGDQSAEPTTMPAGAPAMGATPGMSVAPPSAAQQQIRSALGMPEAPVANALAPAAPAAAPVNALGVTPVDAQIAQLRRQRNALMLLDDPQAQARANIIEKDIAALERQQRPMVVGKRLVSPAGKELYAAPEEVKKSPLALLIAERDALPPNDPRRKFYDDAIGKASTHQQPQNVSVKVNAYVPASEAAQKDYIGSVSKERDALRNASDTLANVDKARALIPGAQGFMGAGGEPLLKAASFLNNRLGTSIDVKGVADATELRTRLFEGIMDNLKRLDSQPSQEQQRIMQEALGTLGTDPNALPRILDKIEETVRGRVVRYNEDVTDAESRGVKFPFKPQIKLPERKAAPAAPTAVPGVAAQPAAPMATPAMAPMYARNPTTGQRIMSTDGGNTWVPAR